MERARILRNIMEEKNMKVADLVRITGIAYSTIKSMLENGIEKTSYVNVCKVCDALGLSTDELEAMANDGPKVVPQSTYADVEKLVARNGKKMSVEQKMRLIQLLSEIKFED